MYAIRSYYEDESRAHTQLVDTLPVRTKPAAEYMDTYPQGLGSTSILSADDLPLLPAADFTSILQGVVPGVNVIAPGGQPGEFSHVLIRRQKNTSSLSSPLV